MSELNEKLKSRREVTDSPDYIIQNVPAVSSADVKATDPSKYKDNQHPINPLSVRAPVEPIDSPSKLNTNKKEQEPPPRKVCCGRPSLNLDTKTVSSSRILSLAICYVLPLFIFSALSGFYQVWTPYRFAYITPNVPVTEFIEKPPITTWRPYAKRSAIPFSILNIHDPNMANLISRVSRTQHGNLAGNNFIWSAAAPMFTFEWAKETSMYIFNGGPTFDDDLNLFFSPLNPIDDVSLVCLDALTGERRWSFKGTGPGYGAPLILPMPLSSSTSSGSTPGGYRVVYHATRTNVWALRALDGAPIWSGVTGIPPSDYFDKNRIEGLIYRPHSDSISGITADGIIFTVSREKGEVISEARKIPCISPPKATRVEHDITYIQQSALSEVEKAFGALANGRIAYSNVLSNPLMCKTSPDLNDTSSTGLLGDILNMASFGSSTDTVDENNEVLAAADPERSMACVAGGLVVNPFSGRLYISASTASGQGAIFGIDILSPEQQKAQAAQEQGAKDISATSSGSKYPYLTKVSRTATVSGGAATPPAVTDDGRLVIFGNRRGQLVALNAETLEQVWIQDLGSDVIGGVALAPGTGLEIYVSTKAGELIKLVEDVPAPVAPGYVRIAWRADLTKAFEYGGYYYGATTVADSKPTVTANGIALIVSARAEKERGVYYTAKVGVGLVDRETGILTHFAIGKEEPLPSAGVAVGLDGSLYVAHAPIRRAESRSVWGSRVDPIIGGISRFKPNRLDLVGRDAACMAVAIAENAASFLRGWISDDQVSLDAAVIDLRQIATLTWQAMLSRSLALKTGEVHEDIPSDILDQFALLIKEAIDILAPVRGGLTLIDPTTSRTILKAVILPLQKACAIIPPK